MTELGPVLLGEDLGKGISHGQMPILGSEQFKPQTGCLSLEVPCREDKAPWLVGGPWGK